LETAKQLAGSKWFEQQGQLALAPPWQRVLSLLSSRPASWLLFWLPASWPLASSLQQLSSLVPFSQLLPS
jgi:hypothetical protein